VNAAAAFVLGELREPAFAVLDGARDRRVRNWVFDTRAPRWCLYRGNLTAELEDAAPWLVRIVPGADWLDELFGQLWGQSWGILVASAAPARAVRRQLRRSLLARTEDRRTLLFRYYDPRVLRVYLPTCTPEEVAAFFGPISAMAAEAETPSGLHVFRAGPDGRLDARILELPRPAATATAARPSTAR